MDTKPENNVFGFFYTSSLYQMSGKLHVPGGWIREWNKDTQYLLEQCVYLAVLSNFSLGNDWLIVMAPGIYHDYHGCHGMGYYGYTWWCRIVLNLGPRY